MGRCRDHFGGRGRWTEKRGLNVKGSKTKDKRRKKKSLTKGETSVKIQKWPKSLYDGYILAYCRWGANIFRKRGEGYVTVPISFPSGTILYFSSSVKKKHVYSHLPVH
jgi:hypothetical protein